MDCGQRNLLSTILCETRLNPELIRLAFNVVFHIIEGMKKPIEESSQKTKKRKAR